MLAAELRRAGKTWVEIAATFQQRYQVNARIAFRWAHGWSQQEAAEQWNLRWPDEPKMFKNFSYWESWPSPTGHQPSLEVLGRLALLYECSVADLVSDLPDYRHLDPATGTVASTPAPAVDQLHDQAAVLAAAAGFRLPENIAMLLVRLFGSPLGSVNGVAAALPRQRDAMFGHLVELLTIWGSTMERRDVLRILGWAATAAATTPAFQHLNLDEQERLAAVISNPSRLDAQSIEHIEEVLWRSARQDYALGPLAALDTVLGQRSLTRALLPQCPPALRPRLLSALSNATRQAGWLSYDLKDFDGAKYYYEDARTLSHEAEDTKLGAFVLCQMSQLATWQGTPRIGIDHAVAAESWAQHTDDLRLWGFAADTAARAYATDNQVTASMAALETAESALARVPQKAARYSDYTYDYGESLHVSFRSECHLKLGDTAQAIAGAI